MLAFLLGWSAVTLGCLITLRLWAPEPTFGEVGDHVYFKDHCGRMVLAEVLELRGKMARVEIVSGNGDGDGLNRSARWVPRRRLAVYMRRE